jgi:hypothetical protein
LAAEEAIDIQEVAKEVMVRLVAARKQFVGCPQTEMENDGNGDNKSEHCLPQCRREWCKGPQPGKM